MAFQRPNSTRWYVSYREAGTNKNCERSFETKTEAEAWALEYRAKKKRGDVSVQPPVQSAKTVRDLVVAYLQEHRTDTAKNELYPINNVVLPTIGHLSADRITKNDFEMLVQAFRANGNKNNTIQRRMATVKAVFRWAEDKELIERAPKFPTVSGEDDIIMPPTLEETRAILKHACPHLRRAIMLATYTGVRSGEKELLALTWQDVDWSEGTIRVRSAKKGGLSWRIVPLSSSFLWQLEAWCESDGGSGRIIHYANRPIKSLKTAWKTAKKEAGITRRLRMYDLRHRFVTEIVSGGADPKTAAYLAGHADPKTTMRVYRHVQVQDTTQAIKGIKSLD